MGAGRLAGGGRHVLGGGPAGHVAGGGDGLGARVGLVALAGVCHDALGRAGRLLGHRSLVPVVAEGRPHVVDGVGRAAAVDALRGLRAVRLAGRVAVGDVLAPFVAGSGNRHVLARQQLAARRAAGHQVVGAGIGAGGGRLVLVCRLARDVARCGHGLGAGVRGITRARVGARARLGAGRGLGDGAVVPRVAQCLHIDGLRFQDLVAHRAAGHQIVGAGRLAGGGNFVLVSRTTGNMSQCRHVHDALVRERAPRFRDNDRIRPVPRRRARRRRFGYHYLTCLAQHMFGVLLAGVRDHARRVIVTPSELRIPPFVFALWSENPHLGRTRRMGYVPGRGIRELADGEADARHLVCWRLGFELYRDQRSAGRQIARGNRRNLHFPRLGSVYVRKGPSQNAVLIRAFDEAEHVRIVFQSRAKRAETGVVAQINPYVDAFIVAGRRRRAQLEVVCAFAIICVNITVIPVIKGDLIEISVANRQVVNVIVRPCTSLKGNEIDVDEIRPLREKRGARKGNLHLAFLDYGRGNDDARRRAARRRLELQLCRVIRQHEAARVKARVPVKRDADGLHFVISHTIRAFEVQVVIGRRRVLDSPREDFICAHRHIAKLRVDALQDRIGKRDGRSLFSLEEDIEGQANELLALDIKPAGTRNRHGNGVSVVVNRYERTAKATSRLIRIELEVLGIKADREGHAANLLEIGGVHIIGELPLLGAVAVPYVRV